MAIPSMHSRHAVCCAPPLWQPNTTKPTCVVSQPNDWRPGDVPAGVSLDQQLLRCMRHAVQGFGNTLGPAVQGICTTHGGLLAALAGYREVHACWGAGAWCAQDVFLTCMVQAQTVGRMMEEIVLSVGGALAFPQVSELSMHPLSLTPEPFICTSECVRCAAWRTQTDTNCHMCKHTDWISCQLSRC